MTESSLLVPRTAFSLALRMFPSKDSIWLLVFMSPDVGVPMVFGVPV